MHQYLASVDQYDVARRRLSVQPWVMRLFRWQ